MSEPRSMWLVCNALGGDATTHTTEQAARMEARSRAIRSPGYECYVMGAEARYKTTVIDLTEFYVENPLIHNQGEQDT